jgi:hypothetical protein
MLGFRVFSLRSVTAVMLLLALTSCWFVIPVAAQETDDCTQGKMDGERDAKGNPLWFLAGLGCGIFGTGAAYLIKPSPPAQMLMGKPANYVVCYTDAYQGKKRMQNTYYACAGWVGWIIILVASGGLDSSGSE